MYTLNVFVSHSFREADHSEGVSEFRRRVSSAIEAAVRDTTEPDGQAIFNPNIQFENRNVGKLLPDQVRSAIRRADVVIVDLTGLSPNVLYELGYAGGLRREVVVLLCRNPAFEIPADITDVLVGVYDDLSDLETVLYVRMSTLFRQAATALRRGNFDPPDRCFWFSEGADAIQIVCSREPERSRFADPDADMYIFVDNLEDRDALMDLGMFLSRSFPTARILRQISDSVSTDAMNADMVVLGGPLNNHATRDFLRILDVRLEYDFDRETATFGVEPNRVELKVVRNSAGRIERDVGYFGRFINPVDQGRAVVLCHGFHTFGTLAATAILSDSPQALANRTWLEERFGTRDLASVWGLEIFFNVEILSNRRIVIPSLDRAHVSIRQSK